MRTWSTWNPCALLVGNGTVAVKTSMVVLQKINGITIWSRNSTSRYILKRNESRVPKYLYIHIHSNIFKSGKIWNESKCSSTEACISKCGIYVCWVMSLKKEENMDTYWMNKIWMNLEDSKLSEIRQSQKDKHCMIPLKWGTENYQNYRWQSKEMVFAGAGGWRGSHLTSPSDSAQRWKSCGDRRRCRSHIMNIFNTTVLWT